MDEAEAADARISYYSRHQAPKGDSTVAILLSRMTYFNPLLVFLWLNGFIKTVNMHLFLVPANGESMAVLFTCKIPNPDSTPSENNFINENLISLFHFHMTCSLDSFASGPFVQEDAARISHAHHSSCFSSRHGTRCRRPPTRRLMNALNALTRRKTTLTMSILLTGTCT